MTKYSLTAPRAHDDMTKSKYGIMPDYTEETLRATDFFFRQHSQGKSFDDALILVGTSYGMAIRDCLLIAFKRHYAR